MKQLGLLLIIWIIFFACQKADKRPFDLKTLPTDWIHLTETDSGRIIFNSCDGGNSLITISESNDSIRMLLHGQQEDYFFNILESFTDKGDTIFILAKWKDSNKTENFKFIWETKELGIGFWSFFNRPRLNSYVTIDKRLKYLEVDQPCKECWDECDEIE